MRIYVFHFFAAILIFLGYKSLRGGLDYLLYFKEELAKDKSDFAPFVSIFVPCRGLDQDLEKNLEAIFSQNFPEFEVVFVVDDQTDDSVAVIKKLQEKSYQTKLSKLVFAGTAVTEGQKVHNLRQAVTHACDKSEVFVFVDSDARPAVNWLANLVSPLEDPEVGCSTGYRWFVPKSQRLASQMRSAWNASIASALGRNTKGNFCWGGSTAIRRSRFEELNVREKWRGTLSDDFAVTKALKDSDLPIYFVPNCLTATVEDCSFRELIEFSTRQMKITRVYAPRLWLASFIGSGLFTITFWTGVALLFFVSGVHFWLVLGELLTICILGISKAWVRLVAVKLVLKEYENELKSSFIWQIVLWVFTAALFFYNCCCALLSNVIEWRGITYVIESPEKTKVISSTNK